MTIENQRNNITVLIPVFNEQENIAQCSETLIKILKPLPLKQFQLLFVDDGSDDSTWQEIQKMQNQYSAQIKGLKLTRNFGKEHALAAGLEHITSDAVIVIDGDLQHPPELIPTMIEQWQKNRFSIVEGVKSLRSASQGIFHQIYFKIFEKMIGFNMQTASDFKLLDKSALNDWKKLPERGLFFRGMTHWLGRKKMQLEFDVAPRTRGTTKWNFFELLQLAIQSLLSFSSAPIKLVGLLGLLFVFISFVLGGMAIYQKYLGIAVSGFTTVILLLLFVGGSILFSLSLLGHFIGNIYDEVKHRPRYLIEDEL